MERLKSVLLLLSSVSVWLISTSSAVDLEHPPYPWPEDLTPGFTRLAGSAPQDYQLLARTAAGDNGPWRVTIVAKPGTSHDPASYAAVWQEMPAELFMGRWVRFTARVGTRDLPKSYAATAYGALFVRVLAVDGTLLAMDNMSSSRRRILSYSWAYQERSIVLEVPGLPEGTICTPDSSVPAVIQFGALLSGGRGVLSVNRVALQVVPKYRYFLTTDTGAWSGHPGNDRLL